MASGWDAFISYSHAESERTAISLQRGLERFARPWYQRRAIRVFRDNSAMSTNPALWPAIEQGLVEAGQLIVLLSPTAAASPYVQRETAWWLANKNADSVLLVQDAGELHWTADGRFSDDSAVPEPLRTAFAEEPRWLDLRWLRENANPASDARFAEAVADLSAPIRGVPRDELIGEDLVQHRLVRRLTRAAITGLTLLLITSIVATVIALRQRDDVLRQAVTLQSRQLAGAATQALGSDLRTGQLLAVQSYLTENSAASRQALLEASMASPRVQHFIPFTAPVTALATNATTVAIGLGDGRVFTVGTAAGEQPVLRWTAPAAVTDLRIDADGGVLLVRAAGAVTVVAGADVRALPGVTDNEGALALSASGRRAAVIADGEGSSTVLLVFDTGTGARLARRPDPLGPSEKYIVYPQYTDRIGFLGDAALRLVSNDNRWLTLALTSGRVEGRGSADWAPSAYLYGTSSRADFLLSAPIVAGDRVSAWPLDRTGHQPAAARTAGVQLTDPLSMAISPNGRRMLVNDSSTGVWSVPLQATGQSPEPVEKIAGLTGASAMEFIGDSRAAVAVRQQVALLDLAGAGRGVTSLPLSPRPNAGLLEYAQDPRSSALALAPDGSRLAVLDMGDDRLELLAGPGATTRGVSVDLHRPSASGDLVGPIWLDDQTVVVLDPSGEKPVKQPPAGVLLWQIEPSDPDADAVIPLAVQTAPGNQVLVATDTGEIERRAAPSGELVGVSGTPLPGDDRYDRAAFTPSGSHLALLDQTWTDSGVPGPSTVRVVEVATGAVTFEQTWPRNDVVDDVALSGDTLLVTHSGGAVEVLPELGRGTRTVLQTAGNRTSTGSSQRHQPVIGPDGLVGFPTRSGLELFDLVTMQPVVSVPAPPALAGEPAAYAITKDASVLISAFFGGTARTALAAYRPLAMDALVNQACSTAGGAISADDWVRLIGSAPPDDPACG